MDWLNRMNSAIKFIEENITEDIDYDKVAEVACCSVYHFQEIFSFITDIPLSEYIRRRRLTLAAFELQNCDIRILDLAVKYGYDSADSFSCAFQKVHGVTPSLARNRGVQLKSYSCISFQISIKGDVELNYRIVEKDAFYVIGKGIRASTDAEVNGKSIPEFWDECMNDGTYDKLSKDSGNMGILGVCLDDYDTEFNTFSYLIAIEDTQKKYGEDFYKVQIPQSTWAVFVSVGPIQKVILDRWKRIMTEWFPTSDNEMKKMPVIETYPLGDMDAEDYHCEIWVPIIKN